MAHQVNFAPPPPEEPGQKPLFSPRRLQCVGYYDLGRTIGNGQFGKVKTARHVLTGEKVAVKIIRKDSLDESTRRLIVREITIMKRLHHSNIIKLYEIIETDKMLFIVMENAGGGEVLDFIVAHGRLQESQAKRFFAQAVSALLFCHAAGVAHRDLKAENMLLDDDLNIKIIDFGLSNCFSKNELLSTFCGSPTHAAPELINKKPYHGPGVDVWSLGVVLYMFVTGRLPFSGSNFLELYTNILNCNYHLPSHVSDECADLLDMMLVTDPNHRASLDEVKRHPWIAEEMKELPKNMAVNPRTMQLDNKILLHMQHVFGFHRNKVVDAIANDLYDEHAATYLLLYQKRKQQMGEPQLEEEEKKVNNRVDNTKSARFAPININKPDSTTSTPKKTSGSGFKAPRPVEQKNSTPAPVQKKTTVPAPTTTPSSTSTKGSKVSKLRKSDGNINTVKKTKDNDPAPPKKAEVEESAIATPTGSSTNFAPSAGSSRVRPTRSMGSGIKREAKFSSHRTKSPTRPDQAGPANEPTSPRDLSPRDSPARKTSPRSKGKRLSQDLKSLLGMSHSGKHRSHDLRGFNLKKGGTVQGTESGSGASSSTKSSHRGFSLRSKSRPKSVKLSERGPLKGSSSVQGPPAAAAAPGEPLATSPATASPPGSTTSSKTSWLFGPSNFNSSSRTSTGTSRDHSSRSHTSKRRSKIVTMMENFKNIFSVDNNDSLEPREARCAFNKDLTSSKAPDEIVDVVAAALKERDCPYTKPGRWCFEALAENDSVRLEMEVCKVPNLGTIYFIRMKRVAGSWDDYRKVCAGLVEEITKNL